MIIEYQNHMVWRLVDNIVSHTSQWLYNDENESRYVSINMIREAGLMNLSCNAIATATSISIEEMYK